MQRNDTQDDFDSSQTSTNALSAPLKHTIYILVRTDIDLHHQMVQAAHAAAEAGRRYYREHHGIASAILLAVPDKAALLQARDRLSKKGIATEMFFEPDFGIGESALGTQPLTHAQRKHLMGFPLWRAPVLEMPQASKRDLVSHPKGLGGASLTRQDATHVQPQDAPAASLNVVRHPRRRQKRHPGDPQVAFVHGVRCLIDPCAQSRLAHSTPPPFAPRYQGQPAAKSTRRAPHRGMRPQAQA